MNLKMAPHFKSDERRREGERKRGRESWSLKLPTFSFLMFPNASQRKYMPHNQPLFLKMADVCLANNYNTTIIKKKYYILKLKLNQDIKFLCSANYKKITRHTLYS